MLLKSRQKYVRVSVFGGANHNYTRVSLDPDSHTCAWARTQAQSFKNSMTFNTIWRYSIWFNDIQYDSTTFNIVQRHSIQFTDIQYYLTSLDIEFSKSFLICSSLARTDNQPRLSTKPACTIKPELIPNYDQGWCWVITSCNKCINPTGSIYGVGCITKYWEEQNHK